MIFLKHPAVALFLACLSGPLLSAQDAATKWSPWRAIDERYALVRMRTQRDDNDGAGWGDGSQHWRVEIKNNTPHSTFRISLEYARWNIRTRMWDPPIEPTPPGTEVEPGEVFETTAIGESKTGFDYRYILTLVPAEGKPARAVSGFANSRLVTKPIAETAQAVQAAFTKAATEERQISAMDATPAAPAVPAAIPAPVAASAKPVPTEAKPAASAPLLPSALPPVAATPASLPPVSVEGLSAAEKVTLWQQRAAQGDVAAMFELGRACRTGDGTTQDHVVATEWYRQAANRGSVAAMTKLGYAYDSALGVERDANAAIEWWKKAAALGDADAAKKLAKLGVAP